MLEALSRSCAATSPRSQSRPLWPRSLLTSARGSWARAAPVAGAGGCPYQPGPEVGSRPSAGRVAVSFPLTVGWALWVKCDILGFLLARVNEIRRLHRPFLWRRGENFRE